MKNKKFILLTLLFLCIFAIPVQAKTTIKSIKNISVTVNQGSKYTLPTKITATYSNKKTKKVSVTWNKKPSTAKAGTFTFQGTAKGYKKKVVLKLTVKALKVATPTNFLGMQTTSNNIKLQWDNMNADYYYVYYSLSLNGDYSLLGNGRKYIWDSDYSVEVTDIGENKTVYFKVQAVKNGIKSPISDYIRITTLPNTITYYSDLSYAPMITGNYDAHYSIDDGTICYHYTYLGAPGGFPYYYDSMLQLDGWTCIKYPQNDGDSTFTYAKGNYTVSWFSDDTGYYIYAQP